MGSKNRIIDQLGGSDDGIPAVLVLFGLAQVVMKGPILSVKHVLPQNSTKRTVPWIL